MSLPSSFSTQSLGELAQQDDGASYRPTNQNAHRFLFTPGSSASDPQAWTALIDDCIPALNSQWPTLLAADAERLKDCLGAIGQSSLGSEAQLKHITLNGQGESILLVALSESEEGHALEVQVDSDAQVTSLSLTR